MRWARFIARVMLLLVAAGCSHPGSAGASFLPHPDNTAARVEYFVRKPPGGGPWPAVVFLHGHQNFWSEPGGRVFVDWGVLDRTAAHGYLAVAVSLPGYGNSTGPADFAGPYTQDAVAAVIAKLRADALVEGDKVVIEGISIGAVTAALVAGHDRSIAGTVLISGLYDLQQFLAHPRSIQAALLKYSALRQTDGSDLAFRARSALYSDIKTSSLIMNGAQDDRTDPNQARRLAEKIKSNGGVAQIHIYPEYGHYIPVDAREREVDAFIDSVLKPSGGS